VVGVEVAVVVGVEVGVEVTNQQGGQ
jgi:hypothetical protein